MALPAMPSLSWPDMCHALFRPAGPRIERAQPSVCISSRADDARARSSLEYDETKKSTLLHETQTNRYSLISSKSHIKELFKEPFLLTPLDSFMNQVTQDARKLMFFPDSGSERATIVQHIRNAFARMMDAIPWIAGSVTQITHQHQQGRLAITAPWKTADDLVTINDLNNLDYAKLKAEHFPIKPLIEEEVYPQFRWTGRPTLQAQINFTRGGIIFAVRAAHAVMDGQGLLTILNIWAAYCRGEDGSRLLGKDSLDRGRLMRGLPANLRVFPPLTELPSRKQAPEHGLAYAFFKLREWVSNRAETSLVFFLKLASNLITYRSMSLRAKRPTDEGTSQKMVVFFPADRLQELKESITAIRNAEGELEGNAWVSTHDGVVSLLWCCMTQIWKDNYFDRDTNPEPLRRLLQQLFFRTTQPVSNLTFFLDARRLVKDPPLESYIGNVVLFNSLGAPFGDVDSGLKSVSRYAYALRRKISEYDETLLMRIVGALGTVADFGRTLLRKSPFPESGMILNSWAAMSYYSIDWGQEVGGRAERVRVLGSDRDSYCVVLPKLDAKDGWSEDECGLEVLLQLKSTQMQMLMRNELFNHFAEWRCS